MDDHTCFSALYSRPGEAYVFLANFNSEPREVKCRIEPGRLAHPLRSLRSCSILKGWDGGKIDVEKLTGVGETIILPAEGLVLLHLK